MTTLRDTLQCNCVGPLTNSGITVMECAGHGRLKLQSANISWGMKPTYLQSIVLNKPIVILGDLNCDAPNLKR